MEISLVAQILILKFNNRCIILQDLSITKMLEKLYSSNFLYIYILMKLCNIQTDIHNWHGLSKVHFVYSSETIIMNVYSYIQNLSENYVTSRVFHCIL